MSETLDATLAETNGLNKPHFDEDEADDLDEDGVAGTTGTYFVNQLFKKDKLLIPT